MILALILAGIVLLYGLGLLLTWGLCRAASLSSRDTEGDSPCTAR